MGKKNDKRLCWSCDGLVEFEFNTCPYCGVVMESGEEISNKTVEESLLKPPYPVSNEFAVTQEEWKSAFNETPAAKPEEGSGKNDLIALLMLIPGICFVLFALLLIFFSTDGVFHLQWKSSYAYLYIIGAIPLLILGYRGLKS